MGGWVMEGKRFLRVQNLAQIADFYHSVGSAETAQTLEQEALAIARSLSDPDQRARTLRNLIVVLQEPNSKSIALYQTILDELTPLVPRLSPESQKQTL
jgi:hypothetical protein